MARAMGGVVEQHVFRQSHQALAGSVVAAVAISLQDSGTFQLRKHAMHGGLGQPRLIHQVLQGERLTFLRHSLQQRKQAQVGRVAIQAGSAVFYVFHVFTNHMKFHFSSQFIP